jgi:hypothetical protein
MLTGTDEKVRGLRHCGGVFVCSKAETAEWSLRKLAGKTVTEIVMKTAIILIVGLKHTVHMYRVSTTFSSLIINS